MVVLNMSVVYKRVLLKVSGEALAGEKGAGFDENVIASICSGIAKAYHAGTQIGIVVGGGNSGAAVPAARWIVWMLTRSACSPRS